MLVETFDRQRQATATDGVPTAAARRDRLARCIALIQGARVDIERALADDFGQRPSAITAIADVFPAISALQHAHDRVRRWMRPRRVSAHVGLPIPGARAWVEYQPLGVVGIVSPWNFPINLVFSPLAGALAAGNRCMIKPSEITPATSALIQRLIRDTFDASEIAVCTGNADIAAQFVRLPFDHILYTGSTTIGRKVMLAAAENLVPVTLELGGKCPVVIGRSASLIDAVDRIMLAKLMNAGQICLAPDYVLVPQESVMRFVALAREWLARTYGEIESSPDYTSIINARHVERLEALLADARERGAEIIELGLSAAGQAHPRLVTPKLVVNAPTDARVMTEEIFGPILPLVAYSTIHDAIEFVRKRPTPLALYWFGADRAEADLVMQRTRSGGVTINDAMWHTLIEDLPFGGVGASGMGAYHGERGFATFSHARAIYRQSVLDVAGLMGLRPPYGTRLRLALRYLLGR